MLAEELGELRRVLQVWMLLYLRPVLNTKHNNNQHFTAIVFIQINLR